MWHVPCQAGTGRSAFWQPHPSSPPAQGWKEEGSPREASLSRHPLLPAAGTPTATFRCLFPHWGKEPGSRCEDGQDQAVASLPLHCMPPHGFTSAAVLLLEHLAPGTLPFQARLTSAFGGFSRQAGLGVGLGERSALRKGCRGFRGVGLETGLCTVAAGGVRRAQGNSRSWVVGEQGGWWLVTGVCAGVTVRTCVSMLFAAAAASASAAMLQPTAPNAATLLCTLVPTGPFLANPALPGLHPVSWLCVSCGSAPMSLHAEPRLSLLPKHLPLARPCSHHVSCGGPWCWPGVSVTLPGAICSAGPARGRFHERLPGSGFAIEGPLTATA